MFPAVWTTYIFNAPVGPSPCEVDIVGSSLLNLPATQYGVAGGDIAFRMLLNGDPRMNNDPTTLKNAVWGVQIKNCDTGAIIYTVRVNASGNTDALEVLNSTGQVIYSEPVVLGTNVTVTDAGANFPCGNPNVADEDFYLAFKVALSHLPGFDVNSTFCLCYFTSEDPNNINKEYLCGPPINPPTPPTPGEQGVTRGIDIFKR